MDLYGLDRTTAKEVCKGVEALLKDQREEVLEDVEHCLGMWVSSEYTSPSYEAECISPKAFWHEWRKLKEELLSSPKKGETKMTNQEEVGDE